PAPKDPTTELSWCAVPTGRFAPSPSGDLHLGNLRTALIAWLAARSQASEFIIRIEDLEASRVRPEYYDRQLNDLRSIGLDWDGPVLRQSDRLASYDSALLKLTTADLAYPCYCSRRDIREATQAPHFGHTRYPGTCRDLSSAQRAEREQSGRSPALRLRSGDAAAGFCDHVMGPIEGIVEDVVLRRNDGVPAYNFVVVVDDHAQGVELVVRGDDLAPATLSHVHIADLLGQPRPDYAHVPLVLGPPGRR
ncbi:UNVERIFIED_CONTAM: hypothetical protein GTU68_059456, partial [Idotea baltica]|nr:hypothetical protein [Idotea baltica]